MDDSEGSVVTTVTRLASKMVQKIQIPGTTSWAEQENELDVMCIVETRIRTNKAASIQKRKFKHFFILDNYSSHSNGRIWVMWRNSTISVHCQQSTSQWIHLQISYGSFLVDVTCVYGFNHPAQRVPLWDFLSTRVTCPIPWLVLGDINCVRTIDGRISSDPPNLIAMEDFNLAIDAAGLEELKSQGFWFTWTNKQDQNDRKWMRLDRALANVPWFLAFPTTFVEALAPGISDHSPLVVSFGISLHPKKFSFTYLKLGPRAVYGSCLQRMENFY
ncbi:uncharacterized protein LOC141649389 [Silene latifolia]|uniref:uncharacterized protein LOC141649389 n=1 Tax=Silene latifolia TaxID=37657 RepID=UPI003D780F4C